uniref:Uncharacterized protein n=1 Tax=Sarcoptes scabiei TaxID=52283 RepID=A0A834RDW0_SARSC
MGEKEKEVRASKKVDGILIFEEDDYLHVDGGDGSITIQKEAVHKDDHYELHQEHLTKSTITSNIDDDVDDQFNTSSAVFACCTNIADRQQASAIFS